MKKAICGVLAVSCLNFSGCSLCLLECARPVGESVPRGARWVKDGMTRESRRSDIAACGAKGNESVNFTDAEILAEKRPDDVHEFVAEARLRQKWAVCMKSKGYTRLEPCDERCLYP